ncbi:MAG: CRISPR-associated endonuclease Cas2 [Deltaproteobacteria bacterium]|jgi:CRISPR-associated protein Cas2|nr:CRISPR-associated endonuclease Cas2 [Deltaproteobacteria bacterium]
MDMLVTYDIANPKRLRRVARIMQDFGQRVQKSIFEVSLTPAVFKQMKFQIDNTIEPAEDGVKYFPLCRKCTTRTELIGQGFLIDPDEEYYIL